MEKFRAEQEHKNNCKIILVYLFYRPHSLDIKGNKQNEIKDN